MQRKLDQHLNIPLSSSPLTPQVTKIIEEAEKVCGEYKGRESIRTSVRTQTHKDTYFTDARHSILTRPQLLDTPEGKSQIQRIKDKYYMVFKDQQKILGFSNLNYTGFDKVIKTYDKLSGGGSRTSFQGALRNCDFLSSSVITDTNRQTIMSYAELFQNGNTGMLACLYDSNEGYT